MREEGEADDAPADAPLLVLARHPLFQQSLCVKNEPGVFRVGVLREVPQHLKRLPWDHLHSRASQRVASLHAGQDVGRQAAPIPLRLHEFGQLLGREERDTVCVTCKQSLDLRLQALYLRGDSWWVLAVARAGDAHGVPGACCWDKRVAAPCSVGGHAVRRIPADLRELACDLLLRVGEPDLLGWLVLAHPAAGASGAASLTLCACDAH
mmetsp:Transcript_129340/g.362061  ORF Transcript_129340/g.362061 Transcript_129340/m.362061 type:complete len:209 (-) Transcript_129340:64-690(-)